MFITQGNAGRINARVDKHFFESPPSIRVIYKWYVDFRCSPESTDDAKRSGRPKEVTTEEMIENVHVRIMQDRRVKGCELAEMCKISQERIRHIRYIYSQDDYTSSTVIKNDRTHITTRVI